MSCANCLHAKLYRGITSNGIEAMHYVRCNKGYWYRKVVVFSPGLIRKTNCSDYISMGDEEEQAFIKELPTTKSTYKLWWPSEVRL